jgi:hypothetical protein
MINLQALEHHADVRIKFASIDPSGCLTSDAHDEYNHLFKELPSHWVVKEAPQPIETRFDHSRRAWEVNIEQATLGAVEHETGVEFIMAIGSNVAAEAIVQFVTWAWNKWREVRSSKAIRSSLIIEHIGDQSSHSGAIVIERNEFRGPVSPEAVPRYVREALERTDATKVKQSQRLRPGRLRLLIGYNIATACIFLGLLIVFVAWSPYTPGPDRHAEPVAPLLLATLVTMLLAGGAGGVLCNLRGLFRWNSDVGFFPQRFEIPFYIRPITGALTGVFTFFVGHMLVSSLSSDGLNWVSLEGRVPYIGLAFLAGFTAQEFMQKLKDVAQTTFSKDTRGNEALKGVGTTTETDSRD